MITYTETWEWLAGWSDEAAGKAVVSGSLPPVISARHAGVSLEVVTAGDGHPFPCLGVKVLVGRGRSGVKADWACGVCSGFKCLCLIKASCGSYDVSKMGLITIVGQTYSGWL